MLEHQWGEPPRTHTGQRHFFIQVCYGTCLVLAVIMPHTNPMSFIISETSLATVSSSLTLLLLHWTARLVWGSLQLTSMVSTRGNLFWFYFQVRWDLVVPVQRSTMTGLVDVMHPPWSTRVIQMLLNSGTLFSCNLTGVYEPLIILHW